MIIHQDGLLGMANPKGLQVGRKAFAQVVVKYLGYLGYLVGGTPHRLRQVVELEVGIEEKLLRCYYFVATTTLTIDYLAGSAQEEQQLTR